MEIIKYGIGFDYLLKWGPSEALREVYQNFKDYGDYEVAESESDCGRFSMLTFTNDYEPKDFEFLRIGCTDKNNSNSIGGHGEGLKMALLVLKRNNLKADVSYNGATVTPCAYDDQFLGRCFGLEILRSSIAGKHVPFSVSVMVPKATRDDFFKVGSLTEEDIIFSCCNGRIVNKPAGSIYVGGIFVCNAHNFHYAYDFNPDVALDRDRKVPNGWSVSYHSSKILSQYKSADIKNYNNEDVRYLENLPKKVEARLKAVSVGKEVKLVDGAGNFVPTNVFNVAMKSEKLQQSVAKLSAKVYTAKKPQTTLTELYESMKATLKPEHRTAFLSVIEKSKTWRKQ